MDIINLTATPQLLVYRLDYNAHIVFDNIGLHGISVNGRLFYDAHISYAAHCHVEGSWDRCCGKGQHVNARKRFFEALLVGNAETLFLVDYGKTQILELNVLLHKAVSAYDHIHSAQSHLFEYLFLLLFGAEAGQKLYFKREMLKSFQCALVMLPCKDGCGHKHCALLAVQHTFECGTESHLCFSEAHVSAEKSVHGGGLHHILLYLFYAAELVIGFGVVEAGFKVVLPVVVLRECKALCFAALCVEGNKLVRHILDGFLYTGTCFLPLVGGKLVELYACIVTGADIS